MLSMKRTRCIIFCTYSGKTVDGNLECPGEMGYLCSRRSRGRLANGSAEGQWGRGGLL